jgi:membrane protein
LERERAKRSLPHVLWRFVLALKDGNAFEAAASIAFWFFLSLVPLLVLLGFLVGHVARTRGVDALVAPVLEVIPATAEDIVRKELERMAGSGGSLAPLGVVGYFWTASSGLHNLMDVFEAAAKAPRRSWWKQRAIALGWVVAGLAAACVLAWALVRVDAAMHTTSTSLAAGSPSASASAPASTARAPDRTPVRSGPGGPVGRARGEVKQRVRAAIHTPLEQAIASALMLAIGLTFLAGFYRFAVSHPRNVRRRVWPGALTAVGSWLVVSWGFGLYVVSMSSYALYYGSLAAVAVMMVWLYLTSLSLVVGAEVNAHLEAHWTPLPE